MRPTRQQVFGLSLLGLFLGLALLFYLVLNNTEKSILQSAESYRDLASRQVGREVTAYPGIMPRLHAEHAAPSHA